MYPLYSLTSTIGLRRGILDRPDVWRVREAGRKGERFVLTNNARLGESGVVEQHAVAHLHATRMTWRAYGAHARSMDGGVFGGQRLVYRAFAGFGFREPVVHPCLSQRAFRHQK